MGLTRARGEARWLWGDPDLTFRAVAEEISKESAYRALRHLGDPVIGYAADGTCRYLNDAAAATLTRPLLGLCVWEVYPDLRGSDFGEAFEEALRTHGPVRYRSRYAPTGMEYEATLVSEGDEVVVVFRDLTEGIVVGFVLGSLLFIDRMAKSVSTDVHVPQVSEDVADTVNGGRVAYDPDAASDPDTVVYRISGAFFFGTAATVGSVLDRIADRHKNFVLDCSAVPFLDTTALNVIEGAARKARHSGVRFIIAGASREVRKMLVAHGLKEPEVVFAGSVGEAGSASRVMSG